MAGDEETYKLNDFIVGNNKLNKSNLNRFYKSYFETACENREIFNDYCPQVANLDTLPPHLSELYRKFERNLKLIWDDKKKAYDYWETDKKKLCFYLKYWIYDQLISNNVTNTEYTSFRNLWDLRKKNICPTCNCELNINRFFDVKELKRTYDYSLFLRAYKKISKINKHISSKNYCKYISEAKIMYEVLEHTCKKDSKEYCKEFNEYVLPYINDEVSGTYEDEDTEGDKDTEKGEDLSGFLCNTDLAYVPNPEEQQKAEVILRELDARKQKLEEDNVQLVGEEEDDIPVPELRTDDTQIAQSQQDAVLSLRLEDPSADHVLPDTFPGPEGFMHSPGLDTGSEGNGNPIKTITSASLVGVPSIIFLLYKFSPVRTWLDPRIRKTKSDLRNSIQGSNELQSHDYNFHTTNMDFNRFNVGYQSR